jgi:hypothetical protein
MIFVRRPGGGIRFGLRDVSPVLEVLFARERKQSGVRVRTSLEVRQ